MKLNNGTVKELYLDGDYVGQHGRMFIFIVEFDNGDKGEYHSKTNVPDKFIVGKKADYSIEETKYLNENTLNIHQCLTGFSDYLEDYFNEIETVQAVLNA